MSKKVFVLVHDYWHHDDSIKPMMDYLFNACLLYTSDAADD